MSPSTTAENHRAGAAAWPASFAPAALVGALAAAAVLGGVVLGASALVAGSGSHPAATLIATAVQDVVFVATAVLLGALASTATTRDLGLRAAPWPRVLRAVLGTGLAFLVFSILYEVVLSPGGEQDTLDTLGVGRGTGWMVAVAVLVVGVAPFAEEILFRGFMYRCLRNRFSTPAAAGIVGLLFGAIHFDGSAEVLPLLPLLAVFGALLCVAYERSGSLYAPILLHGLNNAFTFAATGPDGAEAAAASVLAVSVALCAVGMARDRRRGVGDPPVVA